MTELLPWVFTTGWASGINAYLVVMILGLTDRFGHLEILPDALARTDVLLVAAVLCVVDMAADKLPYIDSTWDSIHTVIRPAIGTALALLIAGDAGSMEQAMLAAVGGGVALLSHLVKAGLRLGVNTSPEPASNMAVSTAEDVSVTGVTLLALANPILAAVIALLLLAIGLGLAWWLFDRIRTAFRERRKGSADPVDQQRRAE
ncbi:MAG: hypothetical protein CSA58_04870 [Micrococcales bacterium]|nr:MAG: hypothetical protein CSB46_06250 [Micrococcales bacterium]PIE27295.1 MAG: hypothetical protein CSA58_04870 [Micrococcales bacterium]